MPKLKCTEQQKKVTAFQATVMKQLILLGISKDDLADALLMSRSTLWARLKDPYQFRLCELNQLHKILRFAQEDRSILL